MALADRIRGGLIELDQLGGMMMGIGIAWAVHSRNWWAVAIVVLWMLGEAPGWGHPMGCIIDGVCTGPLEWWQWGALAEHPWASLSVRGAIWALPVTLLAPRYPGLLALYALTLIMPLAVVLALPTSDPWPVSEWIRGALLGLVLYTIRLTCK
ncbi:MAG: hypothetical protein GTO40_17390 [Deltaproteobacteria bacterium]|nr:hypothetical protein [Deltaproteobacteria bacterium]